MDFAQFDLMETLFIAITFVISISIHEYAHAWASDRLWDPTPRLQWRLTPNPLVHIDPIWFLLIFIIRFGWWKPVIVNPSYYKNPLRDELLVALAGPLSNILLALWSSIILHFYSVVTWTSLFSWDIIIEFWLLFWIINCWLAVFNMLPIPPLDGYRVVSYLFPQTRQFMQKYTGYFWILLLLLIFLPWVSNYVLGFIFWVSSLIYGVINALVSWIFFF